MLRNINATFALALSVGVMAVLALLREVYFFPKMDMIPNPDSSWLIYAAGRMADGQKLYGDVLETNPPLILWISLLPVYVGRFLNIQPLLVFPFLVTLLNIISIYLSANILRKQNFLGGKLVFHAVVFYIAFGFFLLSPAVYGQRELLFVSLILPYLLKSLDEDGIQRKSIMNIGIIAMAAVGFAIKPFFLLLWGMNELYIAFGQRKFTSVFAWHNWVIGMVQLVYFAAIYNFYPEYTKTIVPLVLATYFTYESVWSSIAKFIAVVCGLVFTLFFVAKPHADFRNTTLRIIVWMLSCAGFMVLQRKEWLNHLYPLVFMAGLAVVMILLCMVEIWEDIGLEIGHRRFIALCGSVAIIAGCIWVDAKFWYFIYNHPSVIHGKLLEEINKRADGKYVYPLAFNMQSGFPVIALSKGVFRGSFYQLWPMAGLIIREQENVKTPEITKASQFFYDTLVHDFSTYPPELVWVDENVNLAKIKDYAIEPENRDIIKVLSRDVRFAVLWQNYEKIGEVEGGPIAEEDIVKGEPIPKPERYTLYARIKKTVNE